jgi:hypothetical protein
VPRRKIGERTRSARKAETRTACSPPLRIAKKSAKPVRKIVITNVATEPSAWT